jgi:hypothetical protein
MKQDQKLANQYKFKKMEKKTPFFPVLAINGPFMAAKSNDVDDKYLDSRKKFTLLFPDKTFEKIKKWHNIKYAPGYFKKMEG